MFSGSMVAIITPFKNGRFDEKAFGDLIASQIAEGTAGIVPCGTTGESATLSHEEHIRVIELAVSVVGGRVPVVAGTGSNSTEEAVILTRSAKKAGADAALLICPYYNRPTQEGLYRHFKAVATAVDLPLMPYNIPGRTGVNMLPATVARLVDPKTGEKNIVAIKESSGSLQQISEVIRLTGDRLAVLSGDDALTLPILSLGGRGVVSVAANLIPGDCAEMVRAALKGDWDKARRLHFGMSRLVDALFVETNPIPVKTALGWMKRCTDEVRLPLCPMSESNQAVLKKAMSEYGLL
jgi:4-hydroxy-tetrahydrodipicolinate synthase